MGFTFFNIPVNFAIFVFLQEVYFMKVKQTTGSVRMYRHLALRLRNLLLRPSHEWRIIHPEETTLNDLLSAFSLPLIGLITLTTFINFLVSRQALIFELALKQALLAFSGFFLGLLLAFYLVRRVLKMFHTTGSNHLAAKLTVYASAPLYVVSVITSLVPELFFVQILSFYSFYLSWVGVRELPEFSDREKVSTSIVTAVSVLILPLAVRLLLLNLLSI